MEFKKKILIIDDEEDLCLLLKGNLENTGKFEVITISDPQKTEMACKAINPDLILLDVVMPVRKGGDVVQALRSDPITQNIPIIIMSGLGEMVYLKKRDEWKWLPNRPIVHQRGEIVREHRHERAAAAYGVDDYITKPFVTKELLKVIENVFRRRLEEG